jgi:hypothetical protein
VHIDPERKVAPVDFVDRPAKLLPPGKTAFQIWGDMLGRLHRSAAQFARQTWAISWLPQLEKSKKVKYVITLPVAWKKGQYQFSDQSVIWRPNSTSLLRLDPFTKMALRAEALRVGLINKNTGSCLTFCSESEASALYCVSPSTSNHQASIGISLLLYLTTISMTRSGRLIWR